MSKYATITVNREVKELLEREKAEASWSEFLLRLYTEYKRLKAKEALEKLRELLTEEDLKAIEKSSREFRKSFKLRVVSNDY